MILLLNFTVHILLFLKFIVSKTTPISYSDNNLQPVTKILRQLYETQINKASFCFIDEGW